MFLTLLSIMSICYIAKTSHRVLNMVNLHTVCISDVDYVNSNIICYKEYKNVKCEDRSVTSNYKYLCKNITEITNDNWDLYKMLSNCDKKFNNEEFDTDTKCEIDTFGFNNSKSAWLFCCPHLKQVNKCNNIL